MSKQSCKCETPWSFARAVLLLVQYYLFDRLWWWC